MSTLKGTHQTEEHKEKIRQALLGRRLSMGNLGKHLSEETKQKLSKAHKGKTPWNKGKCLCEETREKMRKSRFAYIEKSFGIKYPVIGKNEKILLDKLETKLGYRIIRQYKIGGYHLDGYIPEINLAIEVDEKYHKGITEKDVKREEFIRQKLGCEFLRIKDYKYD